MKEIFNILKLLNLSEKLKDELRHSWTSNNRQESVAEHSWRLSLMVLLTHKYLDKKIDLEKSLKIAIIHDLLETSFGDIPFFEPKNRDLENAKLEIKNILKNDIGDQIYNLLSEFNENKTYEAKFVKALDKIEANIQHNEANINTWVDHDLKHIVTYLDDYCDFDSFLKSFKEKIRKESIKKVNLSNFFSKETLEKKIPKKYHHLFKKLRN